MKKHTKAEHDASRRSFLRNAAAGASILSLGAAGAAALDLGTRQPVLGAPLQGHKRMTFVNLLGGADGLNLVVPKTKNRYYDRRPGVAIASGTELSLNSGANPNNTYGLHPSMNKLKALWDEGSMAIINQVGYPTWSLSHFRSQDIWSYGVRGNFSSLGLSPSGWISRFADLEATSPTGVVCLRVGRPLDMVGAQSAQPLVLNLLRNFKLYGESNPAFADNHVFQGEKVVEILQNSTFATSNQEEAANLLETSYSLSIDIQQALVDYNSAVDYRSTDGTSTRMRDPAWGLQDAAALIQAGFDTKVFYTGAGGWDHHSNILVAQEQRIRWVDDAIGAYADDLKAMGVWDDMVIVVFSEFGRRNFENGSEGTDHGHGNMMLVMGGGVQGGVYGPDIENSDLDLNWLLGRVDYREIFSQIVSNHMGANPATVFPESFNSVGVGNIV